MTKWVGSFWYISVAPVFRMIMTLSAPLTLEHSGACWLYSSSSSLWYDSWSVWETVDGSSFNGISCAEGVVSFDGLLWRDLIDSMGTAGSQKSCKRKMAQIRAKMTASLVVVAPPHEFIERTAMALTLEVLLGLSKGNGCGGRNERHGKERGGGGAWSACAVSGRLRTMGEGRKQGEGRKEASRKEAAREEGGRREV